MIELRPYQTADVERLRVSLRRHRRVLYVAPTGSGKGILIAWMARVASLKGKRVCAGVHRAELVEDLSQRFNAVGVDHGLIVAGTGARPRASVCVASIPTLARRLDYWADQFDFVIVDEGHHVLPENQWGRAVRAFPKARVVAFTATPERLDGRGLGDCFDDMVVGPSVAELTAGGYLARFTAYSTPQQLDLSSVRTVAGDWAAGALASVMERPSVTGDAVRHYRELAGGRPAVAFCVSVRHAELTAAAFAAAGYRAVAVDGSLPDAERRRRIKGLEDGSVQVLTSCQLISEGLDVPGIQAAILLRPTQSLALYLQQVGRALRPKADGSRALILDHAGNVGRHALPDTPREWSLYAGRRERTGKPVASVRTCMECYGISKAGSLRCVACGQPFPVISRVGPRAVDGALVEVDAATVRPKPKVTRDELRAAVGECRSFAELQALGRRLGYDCRWAWMAWMAWKARRGRAQRPEVVEAGLAHHRRVVGAA